MDLKKIPNGRKLQDFLDKYFIQFMQNVIRPIVEKSGQTHSHGPL